MASSSRKIALTFGTALGSKTLSFNYALSDPDVADVKTAMATIITNGDVFKSVPLTKKSAQVITTSVADIDISD